MRCRSPDLAQVSGAASRSKRALNGNVPTVIRTSAMITDYRPSQPAPAISCPPMYQHGQWHSDRGGTAIAGPSPDHEDISPRNA
jgi:hypothetical protein